MAELAEDQVFERIGEEGFTRLVAAFYQQVPSDPILGPMYPPEDLDGAQERLLTAIDGQRTIAEIADSASDRARDFFEQLWRYDQIVFDTSRVGRASAS